MNKSKIYKIIMELPKFNPALFEDITKFGLSKGIVFYITYKKYKESMHCIENAHFNIEYEIYLHMWKDLTFEGKIPTHSFSYIDCKTYTKNYCLMCIERQRDREQQKHNLSVINNFIKCMKQNKK